MLLIRRHCELEYLMSELGGCVVQSLRKVIDIFFEKMWDIYVL